MPEPSWYKGREQTYIKHFILERYLRKLARKKGWFGGTINFVDGFAGPWRNTSEALEDTSPFIAIKELRMARNDLQGNDRPPLKIRCLFIERDKRAHALLAEILREIDDVEVNTFNGEFEEHVADACKFAATGIKNFTFFFIDPTGWTGYALPLIKPILSHQPGEILINFMTKDITRFIDHDRPEDVASFNRLFGTTEFRDRWANMSGLDREDEIVRVYSDRIKEAGRFTFVAATTILHPSEDRTHFHLIYATRHIEGLRVFRNEAERPAQREQQQSRWQARSERQLGTTGQIGLFDQPVGRTYSDELVERYHAKAEQHLMKALHDRRRVPFDDLEAEALLFPLMHTQALKDWLMKLHGLGKVRFEGMGPRQRIPQPGEDNIVILT
ncbi:MAG: three-Cys-motif partner protein TcmP [Thermoanaerobaculia bacterium]|nr:three-Cys-motif partner protein TcmP [Thermoanaerobaculia bacterium]